MNWFVDNDPVPRMRPLADKRPSIVSVLDIGTSKVCCLIARLTPRASGDHVLGRSHRIEILGLGHQQSRGMKSGVIIDIDEAEKSIRNAVEAAERMAGMVVESLVVKDRKSVV